MMMVSIVKLNSRIIPDFQVLFFPSGFSFMNIYHSRDSRGRGKYFLNSSLHFTDALSGRLLERAHLSTKLAGGLKLETFGFRAQVT